MAAGRALKAVLVDLSGTLHIEDAAVLGAQEALKRQALLQFSWRVCLQVPFHRGASSAERMALRWHFTDLPRQELPWA